MTTKKRQLIERVDMIDSVLEILNELRAESEAEDIKEIDSIVRIISSLREVNLARLEVLKESEIRMGAWNWQVSRPANEDVSHAIAFFGLSEGVFC